MKGGAAVPSDQCSPLTAVLYPLRSSTRTSAPSEVDFGAALRASANSAPNGLPLGGTLSHKVFEWIGFEAGARV